MNNFKSLFGVILLLSSFAIGACDKQASQDIKQPFLRSDSRDEYAFEVYVPEIYEGEEIDHATLLILNKGETILSTILHIIDPSNFYDERDRSFGEGYRMLYIDTSEDFFDSISLRIHYKNTPKFAEDGSFSVTMCHPILYVDLSALPRKNT